MVIELECVVVLRPVCKSSRHRCRSGHGNGNRFPGWPANICWVVSQLIDQPAEKRRKEVQVFRAGARRHQTRSHGQVRQSTNRMTHSLSQIIKQHQVCLRYRWGYFAPYSRESRHRAGAGSTVIGCIWGEVNERISRISPWNT